MPIQEKDQQVTAIILAGGLARRMGGQKKALLAFLNKPMIAYVVAMLESMGNGLQDILINTNDSVGYEKFGYALISDNLTGSLGPLAGIEAGLASIDDGYLLVLPCDAPLVSVDVMQRLIDAVLLNEGKCAVAHDGERIQSTFAIFHKSQRDSLEVYLQGGGRRLINWYQDQAIVEVDCADIKEVFSNINTQQDLDLTEALFRDTV